MNKFANHWFRAAALALPFWCACAGGIPSIPDNPDAILAKGDKYFSDNKYFQSAELYKGFLERHRGHDRADYAQFYLAESYFADKQYPMAAIEYHIVFSNFSYGEFVDDALFKTGVCYWLESPSVDRDQQKTNDAENIFNQFIQTFPTNALVDDANDYIRQIHRKLAEKSIITARWYIRRNHSRSAMIYCNKIIEEFDGNEFWAEAVYLKGCYLLKQGKKEEAIVEFNRALDYPDEWEFRADAEQKLREARDG